MEKCRKEPAQKTYGGNLMKSNMKKALSLLLAAALMAGTASMAAYAEEETDTEVNISDIITQVDEMNNIEFLEDKYGGITFHYEYYTPDSVLSSVIYTSGDTFFRLGTDGEIVYDTEDSCFANFYDESGNSFYCTLTCLDEEGLEDFESSYENIPWYVVGQLDDTASVTEKNGYYEVSFEREFGEYDAENISADYGMDAGSLAGYLEVLKVDPETMEIQEMYDYIEVKDGEDAVTTIPMYHVRACYGEELQILPYSFAQFVNSTDFRCVTFVYNPGTDDETSVDVYAVRGYPLRAFCYDYDMYDDAELTQLHEKADYENDIVIYLGERSEEE